MPGERHAGPPSKSLDAHNKKPLMWPWGGFRGLEGSRGLEGLEGFRGLGAGKRQAWTSIRSH